MKKERTRVVFYSKTDLAIPYNLEIAEWLLVQHDFKSHFDINSLLELYNIKLYFDNEVFLNSWDDAKRQCNLPHSATVLIRQARTYPKHIVLVIDLLSVGFIVLPCWFFMADSYNLAGIFAAEYPGIRPQ